MWKIRHAQARFMALLAIRPEAAGHGDGPAASSISRKSLAPASRDAEQKSQRAFCLVAALNRTKMFHVKRFGTIEAEHLTRVDTFSGLRDVRSRGKQNLCRWRLPFCARFLRGDEPAGVLKLCVSRLRRRRRRAGAKLRRGAYRSLHGHLHSMAMIPSRSCPIAPYQGPKKLPLS